MSQISFSFDKLIGMNPYIDINDSAAELSDTEMSGLYSETDTDADSNSPISVFPDNNAYGESKRKFADQPSKSKRVLTPTGSDSSSSDLEPAPKARAKMCGDLMGNLTPTDSDSSSSDLEPAPKARAKLCGNLMRNRLRFYRLQKGRLIPRQVRYVHCSPVPSPADTDFVVVGSSEVEMDRDTCAVRLLEVTESTDDESSSDWDMVSLLD